MEKLVKGCPHCGTKLKDHNWCQYCGDITWLDEYQDDQLDRVKLEQTSEKPLQKVPRSSE